MRKVLCTSHFKMGKARPKEVKYGCLSGTRIWTLAVWLQRNFLSDGNEKPLIPEGVSYRGEIRGILWTGQCTDTKLCQIVWERQELRLQPGPFGSRALTHVLLALVQPRLKSGMLSWGSKACLCNRTDAGRERGRCESQWCFLPCTVPFMAEVPFISGRELHPSPRRVKGTGFLQADLGSREGGGAG